MAILEYFARTKNNFLEANALLVVIYDSFGLHEGIKVSLLHVFMSLV
jgi:hypothetical protein